jgi:mutator protein MutT
MKTVVAALIEKDDKYLIAQRKAGSALGGLWEFPGGKVEAGESDAAALEREILEEFNSLISIGKLIASA